MAGIRVSDVEKVIEAYAPKVLAENYDNVGLLVGNPHALVSKVMVGLELTDQLLEESIEKGCNLIVVHHPLIFKGLKSIRSGQAIDNRIIKLIKSDISLYAAHTNLDMTIGGLNDYFAKKAGIETEILSREELPLVRIGKVKAQALKDLVISLKQALDLPYVHYCGDDEMLVSKVGFCTGSGMSFYQNAIKEGIDVYITGDMKYHDATMAVDMKVPIIDLTHFGSEVFVGELLSDIIKSKLDIEVVCGRPYESPIKTL